MAASPPTRQNWLEKTAHYLERIKAHSKKIGLIVTVLTLAYIVVLLVVGWRQMRELDWLLYLPAVSLALIYYGISLLFQLILWLRLVAPFRQVDWQDVRIYMWTLLIRQLPGGIWHWIGRSSWYEVVTNVSGKRIAVASVVDWLLMMVGALAVFGLTASYLPIGVRILFVVIAYMFTGMIARTWLGDGGWTRPFTEGFLWLILYGLSYLMGGLILAALLSVTIDGVDLIRSINIWAFAGGVSALTVFAPSGLGIRELSLTVLIAPLGSTALALVTAVLLRFVFILSDLVWGVIGWGITTFILKIRGNNP